MVEYAVSTLAPSNARRKRRRRGARGPIEHAEAYSGMLLIGKRPSKVPHALAACRRVVAAARANGARRAVPRKPARNG
jgi:hypothetical protein